MIAWLQVIVGLIFLVGSAELLVRGASALASRFGISSLVIGLTVVAYGTSAPELAVSLAAAWRGNPGIVIGNVIGSNIANIGLVLGFVALIKPLDASRSLLRKEVPFLLISTILIPIGALGGMYSRIEGFLLFGGAVIFSFFCLRQSKDEPDASVELSSSPPDASMKIPVMAALILGGFAGLAFGSSILVNGAVDIAVSFGISDHVIGLTLIALGTSLPELATCTVSAIRGETDLVVGNVIGSNIFNVFFILGGTAIIHPVPASPSVLGTDTVIMLILTFALIPIILSSSRISRLEGALCLATYIGIMAVAFMSP